MRASTTVDCKKCGAGSARKACDSRREMHISGAEGIYESRDIQKIVKRYAKRALLHPKGKADKIIITIEDIRQKPKMISALPVVTAYCKGSGEEKRTVVKLLRRLGVSQKAIDAAFQLIKVGNMRGAAIVVGKTGDRLDSDKERGVRVSRLGIAKQASKMLSARLSRCGINTDTVKEALVLASKVASYKGVIAELCVSDDPDYTTGYVASSRLGYVRIPHIKRGGSKHGGRVFFVKEGLNVEETVDYLEKMPVLVEKISVVRGSESTDEIFNSPH